MCLKNKKSNDTLVATATGCFHYYDEYHQAYLIAMFYRNEMDTDALRRATNKQKATDIDQNLLENGSKYPITCQNTPIFFHLKFRHLAVITVRLEFCSNCRRI